MQYMMKGGVIHSGQTLRALARIKGVLSGPDKSILGEEDGLRMRADIRYPDGKREGSSDVRQKEYVLTGPEGSVVAVAHPDYAPGVGPGGDGLPVCRLPRVDHARIEMKGTDFMLTMHSSQRYTLEQDGGAEAVRITHRGIPGGWTIEDRVGFAPELLCGLFVFCRYIERENELLIV